MARFLSRLKPGVPSRRVLWDDASLGRLVRRTAATIGESPMAKEASILSAAAILLVGHAVKSGGTFRLELGDCMAEGVEVGDWTVDVRAVESGAAKRRRLRAMVDASIDDGGVADIDCPGSHSDGSAQMLGTDRCILDCARCWTEAAMSDIEIERVLRDEAGDWPAEGSDHE